jgi:hypothetical protein
MRTEPRTFPRRWAAALTATVALILAASPTGFGQDSPPKTAPPKRDAPELLERWKREAANYRIVAHTDPETALALRDEPALHWTNPLREADDGLVLLWLSGGRPRAVACFYRARWDGRLHEGNEFHSLAPVGLTATLGGRTLWAPPVPGLDPRPIPGVPAPAATPAGRLRQMRALAREFSAIVDNDKVRTELRQLSQPLFRYETPTDEVLDGALFAFVLTTDPEALLLLEALPGPSGPSWYYAFARMSNHSLSARHKNQTVWEVPKDMDDQNPAKPYCVRWDVHPPS